MRFKFGNGILRIGPAIFLKGAIAWEWQIGKLWGRFPFYRFLKVGCWPSVHWDSNND